MEMLGPCKRALRSICANVCFPSKEDKGRIQGTGPSRPGKTKYLKSFGGPQGPAPPTFWMTLFDKVLTTRTGFTSPERWTQGASTNKSPTTLCKKYRKKEKFTLLNLEPRGGHRISSSRKEPREKMTFPGCPLIFPPLPRVPFSDTERNHSKELIML